MVHIGGIALRLHSFLELFDENIIVKIYDDEGILAETCIGDVPQRVLNFRFVDKCELDNNKLVIYTTVKDQEELDFMEE